MRTRTAKKLAQRIDLAYFKRPHPLRRWRTLLSIAAPLIGLTWLGSMAAAGSRAPYSSGPLSPAHAFAEMKCETCHVRDTTFRAHVTDTACATCHDGPPHPTPALAAAAAPAATPPACAACHREHQGRVSPASTPDGVCVDCHSGPARAASQRAEAIGFPEGHPPYTTEQNVVDPGTIKFNHQVHAKADLRGPNGPETLACSTCHQPELLPGRARRPMRTGLMKPIEYEQQCARCHQLYFDERIEAAAPHQEPKVVMAFVRQSLRDHIANNPGDLSRRDGPPRRLPLNFPRIQQPPPRTPAEWVTRRAAAAESLLWEKTCAECHTVVKQKEPADPPTVAPANLKREWMTRAAFDHTPHLMVRCESCHNAVESRLTSDVLLPNASTCATCHAPGKGASSTCATCHRYHDWTNARPVRPTFDLEHFR
ncbi:MAG TPA: cytochrome c3 family protein [Vicinamibacterales bacterium]|nr:cytochrome c3 family protein [Vicinamibacterales bacterium]